MTNEIRYYYFGRHLFDPHVGIVTAAALPELEAHTVRVAFAHCAPGDIFHRYDTVTRKRIVEHKGGTTTVTSKEVMTVGGIHLAQARLGLISRNIIGTETYTTPVGNAVTSTAANVAGQSYTVAFTRSILAAVMHAYNDVVPAEAKPRLWRKRRLVLAHRIILAMDYLIANDMRDPALRAQVDNLKDPLLLQTGFLTEAL